jgi:hypothetical protein
VGLKISFKITQKPPTLLTPLTYLFFSKQHSSYLKAMISISQSNVFLSKQGLFSFLFFLISIFLVISFSLYFLDFFFFSHFFFVLRSLSVFLHSCSIFFFVLFSLFFFFFFFSLSQIAQSFSFSSLRFFFLIQMEITDIYWVGILKGITNIYWVRI